MKISSVEFIGELNKFLDITNASEVLIDNMEISNSKIDFFSLYKRVDLL